MTAHSHEYMIQDISRPNTKPTSDEKIIKIKILLYSNFLEIDIKKMKNPEPRQTSKMGLFAKIVKAVNYFRKELHLRCLAGS